MLTFIFDCETGGLDPEKHSIFSIGALVGDLETGKIVDQFEALHKLKSINDYVYDAKAVEIHGITPSQAINEGLTTEEIQQKFMDLWTNHGAQIIGGHNCDFDVRFVAKQIYGISPRTFEDNFTYRKLDSLPLIRLFTGTNDAPSGSSLSQAVKGLAIDMSDIGKAKFHAALYDSICCFRILHKFRKVLSAPDVMERLIK